MKRRGSLLIEVVISILIFTIGILALAGTLTMSLKMIVDSGQATKAEQEDTINKYQLYMLKRTVKHDGTPTDSAYGAAKLSNPSTASIKLGGRTIQFDVYHFVTNGKKGSDIYVTQRTN